MARPVLAAAVSAALVAAIGYSALARGHPDEDAFILFRYVRNLAEGHGIVFNVGGPRSEGATDFAWLLALAGLARVGLDAALAALLLNALGAALAGYVLASAFPAVAIAVPLAVATSNAALPAYVGFAALLFAASCVGAWRLAARGSAFAPLVGLGLGLLRPEGALVGALFALLGWGPTRARERGRAYMATAAIAFAAGTAYFLWRRMYFGLLLPLPLYVKSRPYLPDEARFLSSGLQELLQWLPGLGSELRWLASPIGPVPPVIAIAVLLRGGREGPRLRLLLPAGALFALLLLAQPAQNVDWRFQAPIALMLLAQLFALGGAHPRKRLAAAVIGLALLPAIGFGGARAWQIAAGGRPSYVDAFAPELRSVLVPTDRIAATEVGRLAFWHRAGVEDLVGLTSPQTARTPPSVEWLAQLDPDVVVFHHANTIDPAALALAAKGSPVARIAADALVAALRPPYRALARDGAASYAELRLAIARVAPPIVARYLQVRDTYDLYAVDYGGRGRYEHVYALRRGWPRADAFLARLRAAFDSNEIPAYLECTPP